MTDSHLFSEPVLETFSTPAQTPAYGAQNLRPGWAAGSLGPLERSTVPQAGGQKSEVTAVASRAPPRPPAVCGRPSALPGCRLYPSAFAFRDSLPCVSLRLMGLCSQGHRSCRTSTHPHDFVFPDSTCNEPGSRRRAFLQRKRSQADGHPRPNTGAGGEGVHRGERSGREKDRAGVGQGQGQNAHSPRSNSRLSKVVNGKEREMRQ